MSHRMQARILMPIVAGIAALNLRITMDPHNSIWIINGMLAAVLIAQLAHVYMIATDQSA